MSTEPNVARFLWSWRPHARCGDYLSIKWGSRRALGTCGPESKFSNHPYSPLPSNAPREV